MRRGTRFDQDQAEVTLTDVFIEQLEDLARDDQAGVLADVVALCEDPGGKHPLSDRLAGWNTQTTLNGTHRVIYRATPNTGDTTSTLEVLCLGQRRNDEVYDIARNLVEAGLLTDDELAQIWDALDLLDVVAENVGLDGWDFRPAAAPAGLRRAAVEAGLLSPADAEMLDISEINAAMAHGWTESGPDPDAALAAALGASRHGSVPAGRDVLGHRRADRCNKWMPRAQARCVRRAGHPGPCRRSP